MAKKNKTLFLLLMGIFSVGLMIQWEAKHLVYVQQVNQAQNIELSNSRTIYIDLGANVGDTFEALLKGKFTKFFPQNNDLLREVNVFLVEGNAKFAPDLKQYYNKFPQIKSMHHFSCCFLSKFFFVTVAKYEIKVYEWLCTILLH